MEHEVRVWVLEQRIQPPSLAKNPLPLPGSHVNPKSFPDPSYDCRDFPFDEEWAFFLAFSDSPYGKSCTLWIFLLSEPLPLCPWLDSAVGKLFSSRGCVRKRSG